MYHLDNYKAILRQSDKILEYSLLGLKIHQSPKIMESNEALDEILNAVIAKAEYVSKQMTQAIAHEMEFFKANEAENDLNEIAYAVVLKTMKDIVESPSFQTYMNISRKINHNK